MLKEYLKRIFIPNKNPMNKINYIDNLLNEYKPLKETQVSLGKKSHKRMRKLESRLRLLLFSDTSFFIHNRIEINDPRYSILIKKYQEVGKALS